MTTENYSAQTLRDYLLGHLPEPDAERLDELSITDSELAGRLNAVEDDLVDAFARGELEGAALEQFRARYLTAPQGREAAHFAEALQSFGEDEWDSSSEEIRRPAPHIRDSSAWRERLALAAVLVMFAAASAWLALENRTLRARVTSAELSRDGLQRERDLREAATTRPADTTRPPDRPAPASPTFGTLVLAPQLRSARQLPTVALTADTQELPVQLDLEPVDYRSYNVALIAASGNQPVWRADGQKARTMGTRKTIDLRLPANVLSPQDYLIRVSGVTAPGTSEIVGEYRFTVVR